MHSHTLLQEGMLKYYNLQKKQAFHHFILYKDHLIKIEDTDLAITDRKEALKTAKVMPICLAKIDLYEFEKSKKTQHTIMVTFQQVKKSFQKNKIILEIINLFF